jgi:hypothetical protein
MVKYTTSAQYGTAAGDLTLQCPNHHHHPQHLQQHLHHLNHHQY